MAAPSVTEPSQPRKITVIRSTVKEAEPILKKCQDARAVESRSFLLFLEQGDK